MKKCLAVTLAAALLLGVTAWAEVGEEAAAEAVEEQEISAELPSSEDLGLPSPDEVQTLTAAPVQVWFEEGFGLTLPAEWVSYPVSEADQAAGLRYALGDGTGEHFLYIQLTPTALRDADELMEAVDAGETHTKRGALTFNGTRFTTFIDSEANASCCSTLWGDKLLILMFTPQTDPDFMLAASKVMETFVIH